MLRPKSRPATGKHPFHILLPVELHTKLKRISVRERKSVSEIIIESIKEVHGEK